MAVVFGAVFNAVFLGAIVGLIWAFALGVSLASGAIVGALSGAVVGLLLGLIGKGVSSGGRVTDREGSFVSGMMMTLLAVVAGAIGIIVWVVRAVFR